MLDDLYIGLGANIAHPVFGSPQRTLKQALKMLTDRGIGIKAVSRWYESAPVPISDQPWYVNAVARIETTLDAVELLEVLNAVEQEIGRVRAVRNEPRFIDLDLLTYGDKVSGKEGPPILPHPRMTERAFVLLPLQELDPDWRHPKSGKSINVLIKELPADQIARPLSGNADLP